MYNVTLCQQPSGTSCKTEQCHTINCLFEGLTAGATYRVSAIAVVNGATVPASNTLPLVMPKPGAITLVSALTTSSTTGKALAVPPAGVDIEEVRACKGRQRR